MEQQDTECDAWRQLLDLIETAAADGHKEFAPARELGEEAWRQIITLPPSIGKLKSVEHLFLYGSHLVRIPPEIGEMTYLKKFDPYVSYSLHWFPYEITRCQQLKNSRVSTRTLYGNHKHRLPFPQLPNLGILETDSSLRCSVCNQQMETNCVKQVWISLRVATDVLPLLVNACSNQCVEALPPSAPCHVEGAHLGGRNLIQPPCMY
ncbi:MAG: leucine-rich repeat domain-containing protein [Spirulina sp. SIO3F2]|nr:leucine-rich repeat domain-containing protein [Spirulina sp. SIO3F2]